MAKDCERPGALYTVPFSIFPVQSGGALRSYYLLRELCRAFRVTAFVPSEAPSVRQAILSEVPVASDLQVFEIPPYRQPQNLLTRLRDRWRTLQLTGDWQVSTNGVQYSLAQAVRIWLRQNSPGLVIHTNLDSLYLLRRCRQWSGNALQVLDLHNVESQLYVRRAGLAADRQVCERLLQQERMLTSVSDLVQVCSDDDGAVLQGISGAGLKTCTVPNGVATELTPFDANSAKPASRKILFCGTLSYAPNVEGLNWFARQVWPLIRCGVPETELLVVGRGYDAQKFPGLEQTTGVRVIGAVESVLPYYRQCGVSVCPLLSGSGTRLKILEAISAGNPVVSTTVGCEGLQLQDGREILIRDEPRQFAAAVVELMSRADQFEAIRTAARIRAEASYDWRVIGAAMVGNLLARISREGLC